MPRVTKDSTKKETKSATSEKKKNTKSSSKTVDKKTKPIASTKKIQSKVAKSTAKTPAKKVSTSKKTEEKVVAKKASSTKKNTTVKSKTATKKTTTAKPKTVTKKTTSTKKAVTTKVPKKVTKAKSNSTKKTSAKKKASTSNLKKVTYINEYYDLPYRYNQTIVKILAQTPTKLFVYWDISDKDREKMMKNYGEYFFEATKPVLVVHNVTLNYSFEVEINDFANSWYLDIKDAYCEYSIELGRRPNPYYKVPSNSLVYIPAYVYISSSNDIEVPNNKVLFNPPLYKKIKFRNVKTGEILERDISEFPFVSNLQKMGEFYNVYNLYKKLYNGEDLDFIHNPSSGLTSSRTYSSQFK